jgi:hypothetical protein
MRRANGKESRQKGKHKKRRPGWHEGRAQGRVNESTMVRVVEPAFARAEAEREETSIAAKRHRSEIREWERLLDGLGRIGDVGLCLPEALL